MTTAHRQTADGQIIPVSLDAPRAWPDREPQHGRYTTYCNYGCRCRPCTDDHARYTRERRQRQGTRR